ncbi:MAG: hypothetical protein M3321_06700, partial [Actinomycetota bacterium]|nr:hypothetical protein [Actinomycetota bacterium]
LVLSAGVVAVVGPSVSVVLAAAGASALAAIAGKLAGVAIATARLGALERSLSRRVRQAEANRVYVH